MLRQECFGAKSETKFPCQIKVTIPVTSSVWAFPWGVICAAKLLNLQHPTRLLTDGL